MLSRVVLLGLVCAVAAQEKVQVKFYGEALCPFCDQAVKGPINQTLTAEGIWGIMDFDMIPFGNAFFEISECQGRQGPGCWEEKCGWMALRPPADCFTGKVVCQHGNGECYGNLAEVCVMNMTGNNPQKYMPFVYCFEADGEAGPAKLTQCANTFGLSLPTIQGCMNGPQGKQLIGQAGKKTADVPGRNFVPYIVVNKKVLQDASSLLQTVCNDWQGTKPAGCK